MRRLCSSVVLLALGCGGSTTHEDTLAVEVCEVPKETRCGPLHEVPFPFAVSLTHAWGSAIPSEEFLAEPLQRGRELRRARSRLAKALARRTASLKLEEDRLIFEAILERERASGRCDDRFSATAQMHLNVRRELRDANREEARLWRRLYRSLPNAGGALRAQFAAGILAAQLGDDTRATRDLAPVAAAPGPDRQYALFALAWLARNQSEEEASQATARLEAAIAHEPESRFHKRALALRAYAAKREGAPELGSLLEALLDEPIRSWGGRTNAQPAGFGLQRFAKALSCAEP